MVAVAKTFIVKYWTSLLAVFLLLLVVYLVYRAGKKTGGNVAVTDDQGNIVNPTTDQASQATNIATRIHTDLNSGFLWGSNFFGTLGRDTEAYKALSIMSDAMFAFTYNRYKELFSTSMIADIRAESSISGATVVELILSRANGLTLS